jgi:hypothetical protein
MRHAFAGFMLGDDGPGLAVMAYDLPGGHAKLHLDMYPDGAAVFGTRVAGPQPTGRDLAEVLLSLVPPAGAEQSHLGGSGGNGRMLSIAQLATDLDLATVAAHYQDQLAQRGWQRGDVGENGPAAWSSWTLTDVEGQPWRALLVALKRPDVPRRYALHLIAEWTGEQSAGPITPGPHLLGWQLHVKDTGDS